MVLIDAMVKKASRKFEFPFKNDGRKKEFKETRRAGKKKQRRKVHVLHILSPNNQHTHQINIQ
jgi:hypothetical protein